MRAFLLSTFLTVLSGCSIFDTDHSEDQKIYLTDEKLVVANQYHGFEENRNRSELKEFLGVDPVHVKWCAAFVNSVLWETGIPDTDSLLARSYLKWGESVDVPDRVTLWFLVEEVKPGWDTLDFMQALLNGKEKITGLF